MSSTVDHVANLAGVSKATVSRVLNQRGNVHPDTVKLVRDAIARAEYQAPTIRLGRPVRAPAGEPGVATGTRLNAYALVVPEISGGLYSSLLEGFGRAANARYQQSIISNTADNLYKQGDEILQLIHKRVGGVAIVPVASAATPAVHIQAMVAAGIPVVLLHRDVPGVTAPLVALPLEDAGYRAGQALLDRGHRRVALFTTPDGPSSRMHRRGFQRALDERGLALPEHFAPACAGAAPFDLPVLEQAVRAALARLLALPVGEQPTAIYMTNDIIAEVVYLQLMTLGVRVPEQMSLLSFGGQQRVGAIAGRLSAIVVDEMSVGSRAVALLERAAHPPDAAAAANGGSQRIVEDVPISLADGETLGAALRP